MSPEMQAALDHYDAACAGLISAETAYAIALRQYLHAERVGLLLVGGGTADERCERMRTIRMFEDHTEDLRRAQDRHRQARRAAFDLAIGYAYGGAR